MLLMCVCVCELHVGSLCIGSFCYFASSCLAHKLNPDEDEKYRKSACFVCSPLYHCMGLKLALLLVFYGELPAESTIIE
mgnify:CR=1 FL=1